MEKEPLDYEMGVSADKNDFDPYEEPIDKSNINFIGMAVGCLALFLAMSAGIIQCTDGIIKEGHRGGKEMKKNSEQIAVALGEVK